MTVPQPELAEVDLPTVLAALADPARLATVRVLHELGEASCTDLREVARVECGKSTMSHHLKVLRDAGLTATRVEGTRRYVSLRTDEVDGRFPGLLAAVLEQPVAAGE